MRNLNQLFYELSHKQPQQIQEAQYLIVEILEESSSIYNVVYAALDTIGGNFGSNINYGLAQQLCTKLLATLRDKSNQINNLLKELSQNPSRPQKYFFSVIRKSAGKNLGPLVKGSRYDMNVAYYGAVENAFEDLLSSAKTSNALECDHNIQIASLLLNDLKLNQKYYEAESEEILEYTVPTLPWRKVGPFVIKSFVPSEDLADLAEETVGRAVKILNKRGIELSAFSGLENVFLSPGESTPANMMYISQQSCIVILTDSERFDLVARSSIDLDDESIPTYIEDDELGFKFPTQISHKTKQHIYSGSAIDRAAYIFIHELAHHLYYTKLSNASITFWKDRSLKNLSYNDQNLDVLFDKIQYVDRAVRQKLFDILTSRDALLHLAKGDMNPLIQGMESFDSIEKIQTIFLLAHVNICDSNNFSNFDPVDIKVELNKNIFINLINSQNFEEDIYEFGDKYLYLNKGTVFVPVDKTDLDVYLQTQLINENPELLELMEQNIEGLDVVSGYGASSWYEDFAEAFAFFVMNPDVISEQQTQDLLKCLSMSGLINNGVFRRASLSKTTGLNKQAVLPRAKIRPLDYLGSLGKILDSNKLIKLLYAFSKKDLKKTYLSMGGEYPEDLIGELEYAGLDMPSLEHYFNFSSNRFLQDLEYNPAAISSFAQTIIDSYKNREDSPYSTKTNIDYILQICENAQTNLDEFSLQVSQCIGENVYQNLEYSNLGKEELEILKTILSDLESILKEIDAYSDKLSLVKKDVTTLKDSMHWNSENPPQGENVETLYHTTINADHLYRNGFDTNVPEGGGLGGSNKDKAGNPAIAFTSSLYVAKEIMRCLKEVIMIAHGELTYSTVMRWYEEDVGRYPNAKFKEVGTWEARIATFELYKTYLAFQTSNTSGKSLKRYDPLFFGDEDTILRTLKQYSPRDVGVLVCSVDMTNPDIAYFRSMDEFRVSPVSVISIDKYIKG